MSTHRGPCVGGPLDQHEGVSRFPAGFLLADKPTGRAWIYDWRDDAFHVREAEPRRLDGARAVAAALGDGYDVRALPDGADDGRA